MRYPLPRQFCSNYSKQMSKSGPPLQGQLLRRVAGRFEGLSGRGICQVLGLVLKEWKRLRNLRLGNRVSAEGEGFAQPSHTIYGLACLGAA